MFLLTGLIVWKWFHASVNTGSNSLMANAGLMNLVYLPKIVFPLTNIAVNTFKFLIIISLFIAFMLFSNIHPSFSWTLTAGSRPGGVAADHRRDQSCSQPLCPFFPDLRVILDNLLLMMFFSFWRFFLILPICRQAVQGYLQLNPMAVLITMYRNLLLKGIPPDWQAQCCWLYFFQHWPSCFVSICLYRRFERVYPKIIQLIGFSREPDKTSQPEL